MSNVIILAGGRATRLGPLAAQLNKSLVSVANKPMLVHQIQGLRSLDYDRFVVVVSPESEAQVRSVVERALPESLRVDFAVQGDAVGPVDAVLRGTDLLGDNESVLVMAADTWFEPDTVGYIGGSWAMVGDATNYRSWCHYGPDGWEDSVPALRECEVFIGVASYGSVSKLRAAASAHKNDSGMALMMSRYEELDGRPLERYNSDGSWRDMGDIAAIASSRRAIFNTRDFNDISLDSAGLVTKRVDAKQRDEVAYLETVRSPLYPRTEILSDLSYRQDFIDYPTLAELYIYWPGLPAMWADCLKLVLDGVEQHLWPMVGDARWSDAYEATDDLLVGKPLRRLRDLRVRYGMGNSNQMIINGVLCTAGYDLVEAIHDYFDGIQMQAYANVMPHGDLTFSNTLFSLGTGTFRLVDPRGDLNLLSLYEYGKINCSVTAGIDAVAHGLFDVKSCGSSSGMTYVDVNKWVRRPDAIAAMRSVLGEALPEGASMDHVDMATASQMISSAPMHSDRNQAMALYCEGVVLANKVLQR